MQKYINNDIENAKSILEKKGWGLVPPSQYIIDMEDSFQKIWKRVNSFTMISIERAYALFKAIEYISKNDIQGDIVECGVWKGGACMVMAESIIHFNCKPRTIWLYDTFEGMTEPSSNDIISASGQAVSERDPEGWWAISIEEVNENLQQCNYPQDRFKLVKGDVAKTLQHEKPQKIALLRLDTDWYESTAIEMEILYPLLVGDGVLVIDDYGHFSGSKKAIDEYFEEKGIYPMLFRSDYTGRITIKK